MKCVDVLVPKDALTWLSTGTTTGLITSDNCDFQKHDSKILHAPAGVLRYPWLRLAGGLPARFCSDSVYLYFLFV